MAPQLPDRSWAGCHRALAVQALQCGDAASEGHTVQAGAEGVVEKPALTPLGKSHRPRPCRSGERVRVSFWWPQGLGVLITGTVQPY